MEEMDAFRVRGFGGSGVRGFGGSGVRGFGGWEMDVYIRGCTSMLNSTMGIAALLLYLHSTVDIQDAHRRFTALLASTVDMQDAHRLVC
jgi:hypothetical protein